MSAVLRGRNLPLEPSLEILANALKRQFPPHMRGMPFPAHVVLIPAFLDNQSRLYSIDFQPRRTNDALRCARHGNSVRKPRLGLAGTGAPYLAQNQKKWARSLLRLLKACDRRQVPDLAVADHLAKINYEVHLGVKDKSVGPHCLVAWQHRKGGVHNTSGGHQFYTETVRDAGNPGVPHIAYGMDVTTLARVMLSHTIENAKALSAGQPPKELNRDEINAELARHPWTPDENLL
jgi:hypothetical protein